MVGIAVATIVPSTAAMKAVASVAANTHLRPAAETPGAGGGAPLTTSPIPGAR